MCGAGMRIASRTEDGSAMPSKPPKLSPPMPTENSKASSVAAMGETSIDDEEWHKAMQAAFDDGGTRLLSVIIVSLLDASI